MTIYAKEVILGSNTTLSQQTKMLENNNKYKNLLLLNEDD
jgi:hypothetical protein